MLINHVYKFLKIALYDKLHRECKKDSLIMKIVITILALLLFNGCAQNASLLGPIYTIGTTGNALQAGASYGTSQAIKKIRNKTVSKKINVLLKKKELNDNLKEDSNEFFKSIKKYVKKSNRIDTLVNR
jgi:hypothetical protein